MSKENARAFLTEGFKDAKVVELLQACDKPETEAGRLEAYVEIAKKVGFDFSKDELTAAIEELERERFDKSEAAVSEARELSDEELAKVAGGKLDGKHEYCPTDYFGSDRCCKDTYLDMENCWYNDGCDIAYHDYWDYVCKSVWFCAGGHNGYY